MVPQEFQRISQTDKAIIEPFLDQKPVPLGAMAKALGITVKVSSLKPGESGLIEPFEDSYRIKINRHESRERQRFTLAHEIAHFLLHRQLIDASGGIRDNVLYRSGQQESVEFEANRLAAELVMPSRSIDQDLKKMQVPFSEEIIEHLAKAWQVSKAAMEIKLNPA
ncbi:MAG: ImmA/IrrE family metallo-endopeptidase [Labrenzia sp.]